VTMNGCELPRSDSELVEAVMILHELCNLIDIIVRQLHVDRAAVEVIINNHRLPKRQLHLAWPEPPGFRP
jgi:hypothetical protein